MKHSLTKILMVGVFSSLMIAQTDVSGVISSNTTWSASNSPYNVTDNILVSSGINLTIEAGVTVKFNTNRSIQIDGELIAQGAINNKIIFTSSQSSPIAGDWGGIKFSSTSNDAVFVSGEIYTSGSVLQHCIIEYGGSMLDASVVIDAANPYIYSSTISNSKSGGIYVKNIDTNTDFIINHCINTLGPDKLIFGSNLPIEKIFCNSDDLIKAYFDIFNTFGKENFYKMTYKNAKEFYNFIKN